MTSYLAWLGHVMDYTEAQLDGTACIVCGRDFVGPSVPVGHSSTGSQVFACKGDCVQAAEQTGDVS